MSNWIYDSGGHQKDDEKFKSNYDKIFKSTWPCKECQGTRASGHSNDCSQHWRNKK